MGRKSNDHGRSLAGATGNRNLAAVFLDDFLYGGEAESGSGSLRCETWFKNLADVFGGNRRAVILDANRHFVATAPSAMRDGFKMDVPAGRHGLQGVLQDAQKDLKQLTLICLD